MRIISVFVVFALLMSAPPVTYAQPSTGDWDKVLLTNLKAGIVEADITPNVGIRLAGYADRTGPSTGVHDPLKAVAVVFDDGTRKAALVAFDSIGLTQADSDDLLKAIAEATGISGDYVLLNTSHTHGAPALGTDAGYRAKVIAATADAVKQAVAGLRPVSLGYGEGQIDFNVNRRTVNVQGQAEARLNPNGIVDRRVKVLRIDDGDTVEPLGVIAHAVCHPNVFRGENTQISADFVGLARAFVQRNFGPRTKAMYLQGAAGDIRSNLPPLGSDYRNGSAADMTWASYSLGAEMIQVATALRVREKMLLRKTDFKIAGGRDTLLIVPDPNKLREPQRRWRDRIVNNKILLSIRAVAIGDYVFVGLPGEPVVEYALGIEQDLAPLGKTVFVLGYTAGDAGYIPVEHMIDEQGYEAAGPYWYGTEKTIRDGVKRLVHRILIE